MLGSDRFVSTLESLETRRLLTTVPYTVSTVAHLGTALGAATVADFNGDKIPDVLVGPTGGSQVSILLGKGKGTFGTSIVLNTQASPFDLKAADVNNDGRPDVVTANYDGTSISVLLNKGKGKFASAVSYQMATGGAAANPFAVAVGDFNGDKKIDIAASDPANNQIDIFINKGKGAFKSPVKVAIPPLNSTAVNPESLKVADINGDKKLDLVFTETALNHVGFLIGNGKGSFTARNGPAAGNNPFDLAVADYNGDGKIDIAAASHGDNSIVILPGKGKGVFGTATSFATDTGPTTIVAGDYNKDGKMDLAVSSSDNGTARVYFNKGKNKFASAQSTTQTGNATIIGTGLINSDSKLDLLIGGTSQTDGGDLTLLLSKK